MILKIEFENFFSIRDGTSRRYALSHISKATE